jgi:hypothetical protein
VPLVWEQVWPLLEPAYALSPEKDDVFAGLVNRDFQLWVVFAMNKPVSGIVTRLWRDTTSGSLDCRIWLVGGVCLSSWVSNFLSILIPWAKSEGCTTLSAAGRKGWARLGGKLGWKRVGEENGMPLWRFAL